MRLIAFAAGLTGAALLATSAFAADATGVIKSMDVAKDTVTLSDGSMYTAPSTVKLNQFKVGEKVKISYQHENNKMEATSITPAT
jgi:Cu/Ag efflux protein CusF